MRQKAAHTDADEQAMECAAMRSVWICINYRYILRACACVRVYFAGNPHLQLMDAFRWNVIIAYEQWKKAAHDENGPSCDSDG